MDAAEEVRNVTFREDERQSEAPLVFQHLLDVCFRASTIGSLYWRHLGEAWTECDKAIDALMCVRKTLLDLSTEEYDAEEEIENDF